MFNIKIIDKEFKKNQILCEISIWNFKEYLSLDTREWEINDYLKQWLDALDRFEKWQNKTILLTSAWNWRVLHLDKDTVSVTEEMFRNNLFKNPYRNLKNKEKNRPLTKKEVKNLEEEWILHWDVIPMLFSEWKTDIDSINEFKNELILSLKRDLV